MGEDDGATKKFFVSSGSITINNDSSVQILAEEAHAVEDLDAAAAKAALAEAQAAVSAAGADEVAKAESMIAVEVSGSCGGCPVNLVNVAYLCIDQLSKLPNHGLAEPYTV